MLSLDNFQLIRPGWKIIKTLSIFFNVVLKWGSLDELRLSLFESYVFDFSDENYFIYLNLYFCNNRLYNYKTYSPYKGDLISNNSKTMALCNVYFRSNINLN